MPSALTATADVMSGYNPDATDERQLPLSGSGGKDTAKMHNTNPHEFSATRARLLPRQFCGKWTKRWLSRAVSEYYSDAMNKERAGDDIAL